jgi:hypothetical protein
MNKRCYFGFMMILTVFLAFSLIGCGSNGSGDNSTTFTFAVPGNYTASDGTSQKTIPANKPICIYAMTVAQFDTFDDEGGAFQPELYFTGLTQAGGTTIHVQVSDKYIDKALMIVILIIMDTTKFPNFDLRGKTEAQLSSVSADQIVNGRVNEQDAGDASVFTKGGRTFTCYLWDIKR